MTAEEMAKNHIRHMLGGRARGVVDERVYRFEFPERPGALRNFSTKLVGRWDISMFHYRNHGTTYGRVLVGLQVPETEQKQLESLLRELKFNSWQDTDNEAYAFLLS